MEGNAAFFNLRRKEPIWRKRLTIKIRVRRNN